MFFLAGPVVTEGSGSITVVNPDGIDAFTATNQPYFAYNEIVAKNGVSSPRTWQFQVVGPASKFLFRVAVATEVQYLLVINEVKNPALGKCKHGQQQLGRRVRELRLRAWRPWHPRAQNAAFTP